MAVQFSLTTELPFRDTLRDSHQTELNLTLFSELRQKLHSFGGVTFYEREIYTAFEKCCLPETAPALIMLSISDLM